MFANIQALLYFGVPFRTFSTFGFIIHKEDYIDPSGGYLSPEKLAEHRRLI
jgi:hypothetical protein